jgi:type II secretory pathway component GspD/PulD (secretin)
MDNVLAAGGFQSRVLDNNTVVVGTNQAMVQLGLNRTKAKVFKLSYAHPWDVANLLYTSVFNRGIIPDFNTALRRRISGTDKGDASTGTSEQLDTQLKTRGEAGAEKNLRTSDKKTSSQSNLDEDVKVDENNQISRPDTQRTLRGTSRSQTQEGVGFNNAATDPGSQQIRQFQETPADFVVEQNGGGAIVIPDVKNRQIIVVGTADDLAIAEEAVRLIDRRPKQVHIQVSMIELTNQGIRQLGASLQTQGGGTSSFVLGQQPAGTVNPIPGQPATTPSSVGPVQPNVQQTIAGVTSSLAAQTLFNLLALDREAGGRINMATFPAAFNLTINTLLQTNKAKVVANPTVVVVDNTEALITLAQEVAHKITTTSNLGVTTTNVELTKAGIFLNVLPKVTQDGFITMRLRPQVSSPLGAPIQFGQGANFAVVTLLNIREIMAQEVRIKDGQTLVLGGLFTEQEAAQLAKIPYAAETPILGALFRNTLKGRNRTELMILITPKIVEEEPPVATSTTGSPTM